MRNEKQVVLSGIRATGRLHLGNYLGALVRFAKMSQDPQYECLFFVADLHTLTTFKEAVQIQENLPNIILDYLAAGVDPNKAGIYVQSAIPQVAELAWYLACLTPKNWLEGLPTYKDKVKKQPYDINTGLFTYPVLMAADILGPRADLVPVGKDQKPHIEVAADLARKFNRLYGDFFPIPDAMEQEMLLVPGLSSKKPDGNFEKMGKSEGNTINLSDTSAQTWEKIRVSPVDPQRQYRRDPGNPNNCAIFALHLQISPGELITWSKKGCETAGIGCLECKQALANSVNELLKEFRERREQLAQQKGLVHEVLEAGKKRAEQIFNETIETVRERMGITNF